MKIGLDSNRTCGLFCLQYLAHKQGPASVAELAQAGPLPVRQVRAVLRSLARAGFVERGKAGYRLARAPGEIRFLDVLRLPGMAGWGYGPDAESCPLRGACLYAPVCAAVDLAIRGALAEVSIGDLAAEAASLPACIAK